MKEEWENCCGDDSAYSDDITIGWIEGGGGLLVEE